MALHAHAVAENRAAREWTRGVHRDDADGLLLAAIMAGHAIYERALARARRAGDTDQIRIARVREHLAEDFFRFARTVFNRGNGSRNRTHIASPHLFCPVFDGDSHLAEDN